MEDKYLTFLHTFMLGDDFRGHGYRLLRKTSEIIGADDDSPTKYEAEMLTG